MPGQICFGKPTEFFSSVTVFFNPRISRFLSFCCLMISITLMVIVKDKVTSHAALHGVNPGDVGLIPGWGIYLE